MKFKDTKFGDLTGQHYKKNITVWRKSLNSLEGSPNTVVGYYDCSGNYLSTLEGSPKSVTGYFSCRFNNLTTLEGGPQTVGDFFDCASNKNLKNPKEQIIKLKIKAESYKTDEGDFTYDEIKHYFDIDQRVTRSSMRTLLGLDK